MQCVECAVWNNKEAHALAWKERRDMLWSEKDHEIVETFMLPIVGSFFFVCLFGLAWVLVLLLLLLF